MSFPFRSFVVLILAAHCVATAVPALSQQPSPALKATPLLREPVTGQPDKELIMVIVDWPPGAGTGKHTHPGDEYTTVLEGEVTGGKEGGEQKVFKVGQSYHNETAVPHEAINAGTVPAKTLNVFLVEKGKPLVQPVK